MVASPAVITTNSSARVSFASQARIISGASTMPTKTLAATPKPVAPPSPKSRRSTPAMARTIAGSTPQWNSTEESAPTTSTSGRAWKNRMKEAPGKGSGKGSGPPPR